MSILEKYKLPGSRNKWFQVTKTNRELNKNGTGDRKRLRIAFFVNSFPLLSETFVMNQITGLIDRGHTVDIFATKYASGVKYHENIHRYGLLYRTHFLSDMPAGYVRRILKLIPLLWVSGGWKKPRMLMRSLNYKKYGRTALSLYLLYSALPFLREKPYDILHCQFGYSGPFALALKDIHNLKSKVIVSFRGIDITENLANNPGMYDRVFQHADYFLPVTETFRQKLLKEGCSERKIGVHYSGIDCSKFAWKERRQHNDEVTRIYSIGRLVEKKGIAYAIKAIALLVSSGRNISYTIIGDGVFKENLLRLIQLLKLERYVTIKGWMTHDEIVRELEKAHILLAPSVKSKSGDSEGIPNSSKEAMAMGVPVIGTWHSGNPELIEDGVSGFLVPERDVHTMADRIEYLIDNPEISSGLARAGRKTIESRFEMNRLNDELVDIYSGLLSGQKRVMNKPVYPIPVDENAYKINKVNKTKLEVNSVNKD